MNTFVIDTHALVWFLDGDKRLSKIAESRMLTPNATLIIPTIVLAEVKYLFGKKRIKVTFDKVMKVINSDKRCIIYPFDIFCVEKLDNRLNLHDAIIAATAVIFRESIDPTTELITKDNSIKESGIIKNDMVIFYT